MYISRSLDLERTLRIFSGPFLGEFPDALHESSASLGPTQLLALWFIIAAIHILWKARQI